MQEEQDATVGNVHQNLILLNMIFHYMYIAIFILKSYHTNEAKQSDV